MAVWQLERPDRLATRQLLLSRMMDALQLAQGDISHALDVLSRADAGDVQAQLLVTRVLLSVANVQGQAQ